MDMVERVARAIEAAMNDSSPTGWAGEFQFPDLARAAIAAMREPTDAMWAAAWALAEPYEGIPFEEGYTAMIDAALTSSEGK